MPQIQDEQYESLGQMAYRARDDLPRSSLGPNLFSQSGLGGTGAERARAQRKTGVDTNGRIEPSIVAIDIPECITASPPNATGNIQNVSKNAKSATGNGVNGIEKRANSDLSVQHQEFAHVETSRLGNTDLPGAPDTAVMAPFQYISSLPSKGIREKLVDALNVWAETSPEELAAITSIVTDVHNLSLMLDDVEDGSPTRRTRPATHSVFGIAQTINSATYQIVDVIGRAAELDATSFQAVIDEMKGLLVGQSLDLLWTHEVSLPSVEEYLQMVDGKTGSLFRMISMLMTARSSSPHKPADLNKLMTLFGRFFQIRDDYANLVFDQYTKTKGYAEDLDEGKCSFILIHALENAKPELRRILRSLLMQRRANGCAGPGHKEFILAILRETGSFEHTAKTLQALWDDVVAELHAIEAFTGKENPAMQRILEALRA